MEQGRRAIEQLYGLMGRRAAHTCVDEPRLFHVLGPIDISEIDHYGTCHEVPKFCEVERTELFPLYKGVAIRCPPASQLQLWIGPCRS